MSGVPEHGCSASVCALLLQEMWKNVFLFTFKQKYVAKITYWSIETKNVKLNDANKHTWNKTKKNYFEAKKWVSFYLKQKL